MRILAFIPARGGSKGIPRKNLVPLAGKPLIQHTVEAAQKASGLDEIFLSSDDEEIIVFCRSLGLDVPYVRPPELATDEAPMIDAVLHALDWRQERGMPEMDAVLLLQPTSPLREARHIDGAVAQFLAHEVDSLTSVHEMLEHPFECVRRTWEGWGWLAKPANQAFRRQDYGEVFYFINGAVYLNTVQFLVEHRRFVMEGRTDLYVMESDCGVDVDDLLGLRRAEACLCFLKGR